MLETMTENHVQLVLEVSDVFNAVIDGTTDATMLSGESANGKYHLNQYVQWLLIDKNAQTLRKESVVLILINI